MDAPEIVTDFDHGLPAIPCFINEFNQVVLNLITNAAHAISDALAVSGKKKGSITVSTRGIDNWVEIRIADTGTGVPENIRDRIFDDFFTTKEIGKGTGQGLSIAYNVITQKHGGTLTLESEVGLGTTFIIKIPRIPIEEKAA